MTRSLSADAFSILTASAGRRSGPIVRNSGVRVPGGQVLHAVEPSGRSLLVPLLPEQTAVEDDQSANVRLRGRLLTGDDSEAPGRFQALECINPPLFGTFDSMCDEVLLSLTTAPDQPAAVCQQVLDRWRDLIGPARHRLMSMSDLAGLVSELHLLERLGRRLGPFAAIEVWAAGDHNSRHDFRRASWAAEVKATTSVNQFLLSIHGLHQLMPPDNGTLFVFAEQLEPVVGGDESVPVCIDRLVAHGFSRHTLLDRAGKRGYVPSDEDAYRGQCFTLVGARCGRVDGSFPSLTPERLRDPGLADRLRHVTYAIDASEMADGAADSPAFKELMDELERTS